MWLQRYFFSESKIQSRRNFTGCWLLVGWLLVEFVEMVLLVWWV
jgi:hypothetical protein